MSKPLYTAEDFPGFFIRGYDCGKAIADRANALHDERCPCKVITSVTDTTARLTGPRDAEIERLRADVAKLRAERDRDMFESNLVPRWRYTRLREALEFYEDAGQYAQDRLCEHAFRARAALKGKTD